MREMNFTKKRHFKTCILLKFDFFSTDATFCNCRTLHPRLKLIAWLSDPVTVCGSPVAQTLLIRLALIAIYLIVQFLWCHIIVGYWLYKNSKKKKRWVPLCLFSPCVPVVLSAGDFSSHCAQNVRDLNNQQKFILSLLRKVWAIKHFPVKWCGSKCGVSHHSDQNNKISIARFVSPENIFFF